MIETERLAGSFQPYRGTERRTNSTARQRGSVDHSELAAEKSRFADSARFWSMLAIIALHSVELVSSGISHSAEPQAIRLAKDLCKFGSIDFFLISGFLLGPMFETGRRAAFLRRRLEKILIPWLAWFTVALASFLIGAILRNSLFLGLNLQSLRGIGSCTWTILTETPYWFVPNLFLSTCVLLLMRKHLRSLWLGIAFFALTLFYGLNIYINWIPSSHMTAVGGYIFFLWLGNLGSRHYVWVSGQLKKVSLPALSLVVTSFLLLSLLESNVIRTYTLSDPGNTLRISNQLYSIAIAILIMKFNSSTLSNLFDVRNNLFGVYLTHWIVVGKIVKSAAFVAAFFPILRHLSGSTGLLLRAGGLTIVVFCLSVGLTKLIRSNHKFAWLVGDLSTRKAALQEPPAQQRTAILVLGQMENDAVQSA